MKGFLRIVLLGVVVILGFTVVFPEWFDFKDQVIAERHVEQLSEQQAEQDQIARQRNQETTELLRTLEPRAAAVSDRIWAAVDSGNYAAPFEIATDRLRARLSAADTAKLQEIFHAMGSPLSESAAQAKPGYENQSAQRVYLESGMNTLIAKSNRWSENALLQRTLELKYEQDQLKVDALVLEVLLYPDNAGAVSAPMRAPHVFR